MTAVDESALSPKRDTPTPRELEGASLADLRARVEAATGPNFELECALFEALAMPTEWFGSRVTGLFRQGASYGFNTEDGLRHLDCIKPPPYTYSLDAALGLVERALPGCEVEISIFSKHASEAEIWMGDDSYRNREQARSPALAILSALLSALSQSSATPERT